ncbi:HNH endonuclease [cf. Phormidesmis sp. LEGE 11477]|uniref:HNH endonuclease n=1 Tax=cf. Phormidesmis sp. LEGE 11477 TaxID=1828680 RepID=UPI001D14BDA4
MLRDYGSQCWWCQCALPAKKLTLDHLIPQSKNGSHSLENLRLACIPCNSDRGNSLNPPKRLFSLNPKSTRGVRKHA